MRKNFIYAREGMGLFCEYECLKYEFEQVSTSKFPKGNVLFIDEAYTLCDSLDDRKDFGNHAIECLLTLLARPHSDTLVIMAGYADEMEHLMQRNQGLKGRFPHKFHFDDYDAGS